LNREILLIGSAREKSTRTKDKMTRPFADTSLYEIYLRKFEQIAKMNNPFSDIIMAVNRNDKTLWDKSKDAEIKIVERSDFSVSQDAKKASEIYHFLTDFTESYVMHVNGCFPFLKPENIIKIATFFKKNDNIKSLTCAKKRFNHFWELKTKQPINNKDKKCLSTQNIPPILESVLYIMLYNRKYMLKNDCYWDLTPYNPYLYVVPDNEECLDIDTELEFRICEALWNELRK